MAIPWNPTLPIPRGRRPRHRVKERDKRGDGAPRAGVHGGPGGPLRQAVLGVKMAAKQGAALGTPEPASFFIGNRYQAQT
jgi:hypothetical protein